MTSKQKSNLNVSEENKQDKTSIFVSGLPYDTTQDQILEFFKECGEIK